VLRGRARLGFFLQALWSGSASGCKTLPHLRSVEPGVAITSIRCQTDCPGTRLACLIGHRVPALVRRRSPRLWRPRLSFVLDSACVALPQLSSPTPLWGANFGGAIPGIRRRHSPNSKAAGNIGKPTALPCACRTGSEELFIRPKKSLKSLNSRTMRHSALGESPLGVNPVFSPRLADQFTCGRRHGGFSGRSKAPHGTAASAVTAAALPCPHTCRWPASRRET
jgi:hypothetical protein